MPSRPLSRAATTARDQILEELREDHKRVKKAYKEFQKFDADADPEACSAVVQRVLQELTVHAALEEELLYPAARDALTDDSLVNEAEVEHESMHTLINQLKDLSPEDEKYVARFTVLCEYVTHHVKEEESEMFPELEKVRLDWVALATQINDKRAELTAASEEEDASGQRLSAQATQTENESETGSVAADGQSDDSTDADAPPAPAPRGSRAKRPPATGSRAGRNSTANPA